MFNIEKDMKDAMDRWQSSVDAVPWQGWFWAQGGDRLSNTALESAMANHKAMLENCQNMMHANMEFMNRRLKANSDFVKRMWECPTGVEFSRLATEYMQQAFEDCRAEGTRHMNQMSSSVEGTMSKTKKVTKEALSTIDELKAMAESVPTKVPAKPRRRVARKPAATRAAASKSNGKSSSNLSPASKS